MTDAVQFLTALNGTLISPTALDGPLPANLRSAADVYSQAQVDALLDAVDAQIDLKAPIESPTFTGTVSGITKSMVGLGNVDNTSDANKPVSTATQTALDLKVTTTALTGAARAKSGVDYSLALKGSTFLLSLAGFVNVMDYGAVADGTSHPLSETYATLVEAQVDYPAAIALADQKDWCALQQAGSLAKGVIVPAGTYIMNRCLTPASYTRLTGFGRAVIKLTAAPTFGTYKAMIEFASKTGFSVRGLELDSSEIVTFTGGYRDFVAVTCTNFVVEDNDFRSAGAATACLASSGYRICNNRITIDPSDATAHHDGVIDAWEGSNDFLVSGNVIHGEGIGRYGILVTGQATDLSYTQSYDFIITNNRVYDMLFVGIWVNGRQGHNYSFSVKDNIVDGVEDFQGISIMDVYDFSVTGNKIRNTGSTGLLIGKETSGGAGDYGARDGFIGFNSVRNANVLVAAGEAGWAISSQNADNLNLTFHRNTVRGSTHVFAMGIRGSGIKLVGKDWDVGTSGTAANFGVTDSGTKTERGFLAYSPTLTGLVNVSATSNTSTNYCFEDGYVTISGRVSVTPTAAASADTQVSITLPIASNFGNTADAIGTGTTAFGLVASISADVANDYIILRFPAPNTSANVFSFQVVYKVI